MLRQTAGVRAGTGVGKHGGLVALSALLLAVTVIAVAATVVAVRNGRNADRARRAAESRALAATALEIAPHSPDQALELALAALDDVRNAPPGDAYDARNALLTIFEANARLRRSIHAADGGASGVVFSPDGRTMAVATAIGGGGRSVIERWDARRGTMIGRPIHTKVADELFYSADGRTLYSASSNGLPLLHAFDARNGKERGRPSPIYPRAGRFSDDPGALAVSENGASLLTVGPHGVLTAFRAADGRVLASALVGDPLNANWTVSPDGRYAAYEGDRFLLWNLAERRSIRPPRTFARAFTFGRQRGTIVLATGDAIEFWDVPHGHLLRRLPTHVWNHGPLVVSHDGRWLASANAGGHVAVWRLMRKQPRPLVRYSGNGPVYIDLATRRELVAPIVFPKPQSAYGPVSYAESPDGLLAVSVGDGTIRQWDLSERFPLQARLVQRSDPQDCCEGAQTLEFAADGRALLAVDVNGDLRAFDLARGRRVGIFQAGASHLATAANGLIATAADNDSGVQLWDLVTGPGGVRVHPALRANSIPFSYANDVAFTPDGRVLAVAGSFVRLFDMRNGRMIRPIPGALPPLAFTAHGRYLVADSKKRRIALFDVARGKQSGPSDLFGEELGDLAAVSPDRSVLASLVGEGVRFWRIVGTDLVAAGPATGDGGEVTDVAFGPDGSAAAFAGADGTVRLWDVTRDLPLGRPLSTTQGVLESIAVSPQGLIATAHYDGSIRAWDALLLSRDIDAWRARICPLVGGGLTREEWRALAPAAAYRPQCRR
jgi:WD40 repeat protein